MPKGGKYGGKGKEVLAGGDNWQPSFFSIPIDLPAAAAAAYHPLPPHPYPLVSEMPSSEAYRLTHLTVSSTTPMSISQPTAQPMPASPMDIGVMTTPLAYTQLIDALRGCKI